MDLKKNVIKSMRKIIDTRENGRAVDFANRIGISQQRLNNYLHGRRSPDIELVADICRIYGVSIEWFIYGGDSDD